MVKITKTKEWKSVMRTLREDKPRLSLKRRREDVYMIIMLGRASRKKRKK